MGDDDRIEAVVRVVLVSPGDVVAERDVVSRVVEEVNRQLAPAHGCRLSLWRWETDARPGMHLEGPQGLIDERMQIDQADIVIGVFWKRFGTPTHEEQSGTEHELRRAWDAWREHQRPDVMVYFSRQPASPETSIELEQWQRVVKFREELPKEQLWWPYATVEEFQTLIRRHLDDVVLRRDTGARRETEAVAAEPHSRVRFGLPLVPSTFTGRDGELSAIDEALAVADRAVVSQAITGLGGVGKSRLAMRYVELHHGEYEVVAFIRAEDGGIADLAGLAARLGVPAAEQTPQERAQAALDWLTGTERRWLLVLDNIASPADLEACMPRSGNGRVLITTRDRTLSRYAPALALEVFDPAAAIEYLTREVGRPADTEGAQRLAAALGYLPLALAHAAAYCQSGTSFDDYLRLLNELPAPELFDTSPEASYEQTVASTWTVSIQSANATAPLAGAVLELAAHLAPDAIPRALCAVLIDSEQPVEAKRLGDAVNALARLSLAAVDEHAVSVHRLLQKVVRDECRARQDQTAAGRALTALDRAFPDGEVPGVWPECERLLPHVQALAATLDPAEDQAEQLVDLLYRTCQYLIHSGGWDRARELCETAAGTAADLLGPDHLRTLRARDRLATAYQYSGNPPGAIAIFEPLLADYERILGPEDRETLISRNNLAAAYQASGRIDEAIAIYEPLLADRERILGPEHPDTLGTRNNLAGAYRGTGRADEAIAIFAPLLPDLERILGCEHPTTLTARNNLALAYQTAGRMDQAIAIYEPLLLDLERILGREHPTTHATRHNLAVAYEAAGRIDEAIAIFEPLVPDRERILGREHPSTLAVRNNLAGAYRSAGRVGEAIAILEVLLPDGERILGPGHPDTLTIRNNLASAYEAAGRREDAARLRGGS